MPTLRILGTFDTYGIDFVGDIDAVHGDPSFLIHDWRGAVLTDRGPMVAEQISGYLRLGATVEYEAEGYRLSRLNYPGAGRAAFHYVGDEASHFDFDHRDPFALCVLAGLPIGTRAGQRRMRALAKEPTPAPEPPR